MKQLPIISLFCGAGGLDLGFRQQGFKTVLAIDSDETAVSSFNLNAKAQVAVRADLSKMSANEVFKLLEERAPRVHPIGVLGGPPCQGFSSANVHANPDDPRNVLPFRYAELLAELNHRYGLHFFLFENVPGLKLSRHLDRFEKIRRAFENAHFRLSENVLDAVNFGVPQSRPRVFLIGLNKSLYPGMDFPFPSGEMSRMSVRAAIGDLPKPAFFARGMDASEIPHHPNHWTMVPKSSRFETKDFNPGRSFKRLVWREPSPTVAYGNREIHIHPDGKRRLSVYEAMLLQGFPKDYRLLGHLSAQVTQVCNAVPPPVAKALAGILRRMVLRRMRNAQPHAIISTEHAHV